MLFPVCYMYPLLDALSHFFFVLFQKYNSILHVKSVVSLLGLPFYVSSCLAAFCRLVDVEGYAGLLRWTWLRE